MIKVIKPDTVPKTLLEVGKKEDDQNRMNYDADPQSYIDGRKTFDIFNKIYGHSSVKKVLKNLQNNKCCFCEKDQKDEDGAIEHFRPKGGYHSVKKEKLNKPGYYWLAYSWSNLYFVCSACNSIKRKGNLFPLADESKRAKSHYDDVSNETPLLLNPGGPLDPREHISFENGLPIGKSIYGKTTISVCGLARETLNDDRKTLISDIEARIAILKLGKKIGYQGTKIKDAEIFIKNSMASSAKFSAAANDFVIKKGLQHLAG